MNQSEYEIAKQSCLDAHKESFDIEYFAKYLYVCRDCWIRHDIDQELGERLWNERTRRLTEFCKR